ncbi:unnamed protein product [Brachionus calyciflorus]|uniref:Charged multivesicular body protein 7 n=1 Tax=Brachionus calyciflorus TaxID=104777 RepID=A0A813TPM3_9BILA|nr:unnamed protein product [Brachionus calyciflorus]
MQTSLHNISLSSPYRTINNDQLNASNNESIYYIEDEEEILWKSRPDEWSDDVRMNALFAPFRNRDLNPLHYDNKIKFWKQVIVSFCDEKKKIQFDQKKLENYFIRKGKKPKCLELVINELHREKSILTSQEFLKPKSGILVSMFNKLVWSPISWSTSYLFKASNSNGESTTTFYSSSFTPKSPKSNLENSFSSPQKVKDSQIFILPNIAETKSLELLKKIQSQIVYNNVDCVLEYEKLFHLVSDTLNDQDLDLILKYLEINQKILIIESNELNTKLIKFCSNSNQNVLPLNEIELSYLKLKDTEKKLEFESDKLTNQIDSLNNDIKVQLKLGNKNTALKLLKKRKQLEKSLENKDNILNNIEAMIMSIQQADTNKITMDVLAKGVNALKEANKGVNIDQIDDTMCEFQDIYNQNNEIEEALAKSPIGNKTIFDDQELNDELNELLAQESLENNQNECVDGSFKMDDLLKNLPSVPDSSPKKSQITSKQSFSFNH